MHTVYFCLQPSCHAGLCLIPCHLAAAWQFPICWLCVCCCYVCLQERLDLLEQENDLLVSQQGVMEAELARLNRLLQQKEQEVRRTHAVCIAGSACAHHTCKGLHAMLVLTQVSALAYCFVSVHKQVMDKGTCSRGDVCGCCTLCPCYTILMSIQQRISFNSPTPTMT